MDVSLILCTRNRASALREALRAIGGLVFDGQWECVIVDNGSTDNTRDVIDKFAASAPFPVRYTQQPIKGLSNARNAGLAAAADRLSSSPMMIAILRQIFCLLLPARSAKIPLLDLLVAVSCFTIPKIIQRRSMNRKSPLNFRPVDISRLGQSRAPICHFAERRSMLQAGSILCSEAAPCSPRRIAILPRAFPALAGLGDTIRLSSLRIIMEEERRMCPRCSNHTILGEALIMRSWRCTTALLAPH